MCVCVCVCVSVCVCVVVVVVCVCVCVLHNFCVNSAMAYAHCFSVTFVISRVSKPVALFILLLCFVVSVSNCFFKHLFFSACFVVVILLRLLLLRLHLLLLSSFLLYFSSAFFPLHLFSFLFHSMFL